MGALISGSSEDLINLSGEFGLSLGMNYQVFDDLMDAFENPLISNKTSGLDWGSGKMTLPTILLKETANTVEIEMLEQLFLSKNKNKFGDARHEIIFLFEKYDILEKCTMFLSGKLELSKSLVAKFPDPSLRQDLHSFFMSFAHKLTKIKDLKTSNFLAV